MKLTGERPIEGQTPDSLLALHAAGYREVRARVGAGRMLVIREAREAPQVGTMQ